MKMIPIFPSRWILLTAVLGAVPSGHAQFFNPGNIEVLQVGDGTATLASSGDPVFLDQFTTGGSLVNSVAIPTTGAGALIIGSAGSDGGLTLSGDGRQLVVAGYHVNLGSVGSSLANASAATVPRGVGVVDLSGSFTLATSTTTFYSGNNFRSATGDGSGNYWGAGALSTSGTTYLGLGTPATISTNNSITVQNIGGNLFYSTAKGTTGIYEIPGNPTSGFFTPTLVLANSNPFGFSFNSGMTTAYVANNTSGIQRYDFSGGSWSLTYTLDSGTAMQGLAVEFGATNVLFATTSDGKSLLEIADNGSGSSATLLDTAPANELYRGVSLTPSPEPATGVLLVCGLAALCARGRRNESQ